MQSAKSGQPPPPPLVESANANVGGTAYANYSFIIHDALFEKHSVGNTVTYEKKKALAPGSPPQPLAGQEGLPTLYISIVAGTDGPSFIDATSLYHSRQTPLPSETVNSSTPLPSDTEYLQSMSNPMVAGGGGEGEGEEGLLALSTHHHTYLQHPPHLER